MQEVFDYTSQDTFELENKKLFDRFYHFGAHRSELASVNDFRRITAGGRDVVLFNDNNTIIAFENRCPHRGCQLLKDSNGNGELLCPYHGWRFGEKKCIIPNRKSFKEADIESINLSFYSIEFCGDFLFFSPHPSTSLQTQLGSFWNLLEMISHDITEKIDDNNHPFNANWKISLENALENYHVSTVHPHSLGLLLPSDGKVTYEGKNSLWESSIGNQKIQNKLLKVQPLFQNTYRNENYFSLYLFPFSMLSSTYGYSYAFQHFFPKSPTETLFSSRTYATRTDYTDFFTGVAALNRQIFSEDADICQRVQAASATETSFVYNQQEQRIEIFHTFYKEALYS